MKWSWPPPLAVSGRGAKIASKGPSLTGTREGKGRMPKRQAARIGLRPRSMRLLPAHSPHRRQRVQTRAFWFGLAERRQALKVIAQGRSLDAVVADLSSWGRQWTPPFGSEGPPGAAVGLSVVR